MTTSNPLIQILSQYDSRMGKAWELVGDRVIVGDVHVPFTDYKFAERVALVGKKQLRKPRRLLVAGDFFNLDLFSTYIQIVEPPTWAQEREAARAVLHYWLETFDKIEMLMGNHERRLQRFTAGAFEEDDLIALVISNRDKVEMSGFGWCHVESAGVDWMIEHPKEYSINRLTVANEHANKYRTNIISFHEHHLGKSFDRYGHYVIVNGGCLVDSAKLDYVMLDPNKKPAMDKGFVLLKNGIAEPLGEFPFTDWAKWI